MITPDYKIIIQISAEQLGLATGIWVGANYGTGRWPTGLSRLWTAVLAVNGNSQSAESKNCWEQEKPTFISVSEVWIQHKVAGGLKRLVPTDCSFCSFVLVVLFLRQGFCVSLAVVELPPSADQTGLAFRDLCLPLPSQCWDQRHAPPPRLHRPLFKTVNLAFFLKCSQKGLTA